MGTYYSLTSRGERTRRSLRKKQDLSDQEFVLQEVGREQPAKEERFLHHMEKLGFDSEAVLDHLWELVETGQVE